VPVVGPVKGRHGVPRRDQRRSNCRRTSEQDIGVGTVHTDEAEYHGRRGAHKKDGAWGEGQRSPMARTGHRKRAERAHIEHNERQDGRQIQGASQGGDDPPEQVQVRVADGPAGPHSP
jgi:hypothetical protein